MGSLKLHLKNTYKMNTCKIKYNITYVQHLELNENYKHNLLNLHSSWDEVNYIIYLPTIINNKIICNWWDIDILIQLFNNNLNRSDMNKPCPIFPHDPFTRVYYNITQLKYFFNTILNLKKNIPIPLLFLNQYINKFNTNPCQDTFINFICENKLGRFKLLNIKDSQDNYQGEWIDYSVPLSIFEQNFKEFENISPYITNNRNTLSINPEYLFFRDILDNIPDED